MKNLGFSSPYARVGFFFCVLSTILGGYVLGRQPAAVYAADTFNAPYFPTTPSQDLFDAIRSHEERDAREYLNAVNAEPCFEVKIDPKLLEGTETNNQYLFHGAEITFAQDLLVAEFKTELAASFSDEVWKRDPKCFDGSFVVSFGVNEDGSLGDNMLVHHVKGGSNMAGVAVLDVLLEMNRNGHRWHDGTQGAGEVRVPVSFRWEQFRFVPQI